MRLSSLPRLLFPALLLAGCGAPAPGTLVESSRQRLAASAAPAEDVGTAARDVTTFGADFLRTLRAEQGGNLNISPLSLSVALTMTSAGAEGDTAAEMHQALRHTLPAERLHPAYNALDLSLASAAEGAKHAFELRQMNQLFAQDGLALEAPFLDILAESHGAGVRLLDFVARPEPAREAINAWVADETRQRIQDLLPRGLISSDTRLVLVNALYFHANWATPFAPEATSNETFNLSDGATRLVKMMHGKPTLRTTEHDGIQALELPYDGDRLAMLILLPQEGTLAELEARFDGALLEEVVGALGEPEQRTVALPRFTFETQVGAKPILEALGMRKAFTGEAELGGITREQALSVSAVQHKTFIAVEEAGTEAAAASAVVINERAAPRAGLIVDRPFLFAIRDRATGLVLFLGSVVDP